MHGHRYGSDEPWVTRAQGQTSPPQAHEPTSTPLPLWLRLALVVILVALLSAVAWLVAGDVLAWRGAVALASAATVAGLAHVEIERARRHALSREALLPVACLFRGRSARWPVFWDYFLMGQMLHAVTSVQADAWPVALALGLGVIAVSAAMAGALVRFDRRAR